MLKNQKGFLDLLAIAILCIFGISAITVTKIVNDQNKLRQVELHIDPAKMEEINRLTREETERALKRYRDRLR